MDKPRLFVSVSGGRSSLYMAWKLATEYRHRFELLFGFADEGEGLVLYGS